MKSRKRHKEDRHNYEHNLSLKKSLTQASPHHTPCFFYCESNQSRIDMSI